MSVRAALVAAALLAGCGGEPATPDAMLGRGCEEYKDVPMDYNRLYDVLFVVDESASMANEQAMLAQNFRNFMLVLQNIEGGLPDVHIAVVSSDLASSGRFVGGGFLDDSPNPDGTRNRNYDGTLEDAFVARALLGASGGEPSQPLEAMRRALDGSIPENAGFLRDPALLLVVILTDDDDCSAADGGAFALVDPFRCVSYGVSCDGAPVGREPASYASCAPQAASAYVVHPGAYVDFLRSLKNDPNLVVVSVVAGSPAPFEVVTGPALAPSCSSASGEATPAVRLSWFASQFPNRNTLVSICNSDISDAMIQVAELLARVIGNPCLQGPLDVTDLRPNVPGLQLDCQVSDVMYPQTDQQTETPLPRCELAGGARPCWRVEEDAASCPDTETHLVLYVDRADYAPNGTHVIARCACF